MPDGRALGELLRAQIGYADRAQELLLAAHLGRVNPLRRRDSLSLLDGQLRQLGLAARFASRRPLRVELVLLRPLGLLRSTANPSSSVTTPHFGQGLG